MDSNNSNPMPMPWESKFLSSNEANSVWDEGSRSMKETEEQAKAKSSARVGQARGCAATGVGFNNGIDCEYARWIQHTSYLCTVDATAS